MDGCKAYDLHALPSFMPMDKIQQSTGFHMTRKRIFQKAASNYEGSDERTNLS